MRLAVHLARHAAVSGSATRGRLADLGRACEDAGVAALSLPDHALGLAYQGPVVEAVLDGYTALGFLAARTSTLELHLLDGAVGLRHPMALARTVATLDVLSGGRAVLGAGAGWFEREHRLLGAPFPPLRDRFAMLEESLRLVRQAWSSDDGPFEGRFYSVPETVCLPAPLRRVPVLLSGTGERRALRVVATHADACHLFAGGDHQADFVARRLAALREHCVEAGTDYQAIRRTVMWTDPVDPAEPGRFLEAMAALSAVGVEQVHLGLPVDEPARFVTALGGSVVGSLDAL